LRNDIFGGSKVDAFFTVKNQGGFQMKKIIGLALALAAAALVFVGCSDSTGEGDVDGNKWEATMTVDATGADGAVQDINGTNVQFRRYWKQLGTKEEVAGITTTITIDKAATNGTNAAVVGLMFDYNDGTRDDSKDFCLVGINLYRKGAPADGPQFYVVRYEGIQYQKKLTLDTNWDDLIYDVNNTSYNKNGEGVKVGTDKNLTGTDTIAWETLTKNQYTVSEDGNTYTVVVNIRPVLNEATKKGTAYEVRLGKDVNTAVNSDSVATYTIPTTRNSNYYTKIKVGGETYEVPCGGIAVYGCAKSEKVVKGGTKIVATYSNTVRGTNGKDQKIEGKTFGSEADLGRADTGIIGNLQLASESDDNITVIVE